MKLTIRKSTIKNVVTFLALFIIIIIGFTMIQNRNTKIKETISLGAVEVYVRDLANMKNFYSDIVGLEVLNENNNDVLLGDRNREIIKLIKQENYQFPSSTEAGLYHSAIVFSTREKLANTINNVIINRPNFYQGSSDHIATEAFYFSDPERNGLELYFDKPRSDWQFDAQGRPLMGSIYIDEMNYIQQYATNNNIANDTKMGHVHLKVGDILQAKKFYVDILEFEIMNESAQTLFVSRDKYHHHIGMNSWESNGAGQRTENTFGLARFNIDIYDGSLFNRILENLKKEGVEFSQNDSVLEVSDPWGNIIVLTSK